jgi:hypothetical protein
MALRYVLDEQMPRALWRALQGHNAAGIDPVDVVRVGDPADLPRGTKDPALLLWAERAGRLVVSLDKQTMPGHLAGHLQGGHHSPGILLIHPQASFPQVVSFLVVAAHGSDPSEWEDQIVYIP